MRGAFACGWLALVLGCASPLGDEPTRSVDASPSCADVTFALLRAEISPAVPTVATVEWRVSGFAPSHARVIYRLKDPSPTLLNVGGAAPVDVQGEHHRATLLGLKPERDYRLHLEVHAGESTCRSDDIDLPTTGQLPLLPEVTVHVARAERREPGFIVTSTGTGTPSAAFIIDADGDVVWSYAGPRSVTRALMDYEGRNMWMLSLNLTNSGGEMRYVSMDGTSEERDVAGLEHAHHDFTVLPGGRIAALAWGEPGIDPASDVIVREPDGQVTTRFRIGKEHYLADTYHANAIHYVEFDNSFTISDRNPNVFLKLRFDGTPVWQLGGSCEGAPTAPACVPLGWEVTHGHHLLPDGTFVLFNNTYGERAHVWQFQVQEEQGGLNAVLVKDYVGEFGSSTLGDVQRLPNGNTLITYSGSNTIVELDATWREVQRFEARVGYSNWRPTLYGPPARP